MSWLNNDEKIGKAWRANRANWSESGESNRVNRVNQMSESNELNWGLRRIEQIGRINNHPIRMNITNIDLYICNIRPDSSVISKLQITEKKDKLGESWINLNRPPDSSDSWGQILANRTNWTNETNQKARIRPSLWLMHPYKVWPDVYCKSLMVGRKTITQTNKTFNTNLQECETRSFVFHWLAACIQVKFPYRPNEQQPVCELCLTHRLSHIPAKWPADTWV